MRVVWWLALIAGCSVNHTAEPERPLDPLTVPWVRTLSFYVPPAGSPDCRGKPSSVVFAYAEIWRGHPTKDGPVSALVDTVHVSALGDEVVTRNVLAGKHDFVKVRLVDAWGNPGCWATLGDMERPKEPERDKVKAWE